MSETPAKYENEGDNNFSANGRVVINGKEYKGKSISICNGEIIIDGKSVDNVGQVNSIKSGAMTITIHGDVANARRFLWGCRNNERRYAPTLLWTRS